MSQVVDTALRVALTLYLQDEAWAFPADVQAVWRARLQRTDGDLGPANERLWMSQMLAEWAEAKHPSVSLALRRALGEEIARDPVPRYTTAPASTGMPERASTQPSKSCQIKSITDRPGETTVMTPEYERELAIIAHEFERPPYWFPDDTQRLTRAVSLVREGKVSRNADNTYDVVGSRGTIYTCWDECPCPAGQKSKSKWCAHLIAVQVFNELHVRIQPALFQLPPTVDERLAESAPHAHEDAQEATHTSLPISDHPQASETIVAPLRGQEVPGVDELAEDAALDETALKSYRQTIVRQLAALGCRPKEKAEFEDTVMAYVGLVLAPENFPLITARLSAILTARAKTAPARIPEEYLVDIKGKQHVLFIGLLAMAHERGLISLTAEFVSVTADLALAKATATFADGRTFTEAADATPGNVGPQVKPHFARMSLTRAKARCLRDALSLNVVSAEEVE